MVTCKAFRRFAPPQPISIPKNQGCIKKERKNVRRALWIGISASPTFVLYPFTSILPCCLLLFQAAARRYWELGIRLNPSRLLVDGCLALLHLYPEAGSPLLPITHALVHCRSAARLAVCCFFQVRFSTVISGLALSRTGVKVVPIPRLT
jgi:hypothetical protein